MRRATLDIVHWSVCVLIAACVGACGDDDTGTVVRPVDGNPSGADASVDEDGGADELLPGFSGCEGEDDGTRCGPMHLCIGETCQPWRCGDGVLTEGEECDDGNEAAGDACNPSCRATPATCGDGEINDEDEECDDGNRINDDACANSCTVNVCGNQRLDVDEECDDGNDVDDDGCSNACMNVRCRNGRLDPGEECDDGNRINDDGCTNACIAVRCGDGVVYDRFEECDDGNTIDNDTCSNDCLNVLCGNNRIDGNEACDGTDLPPGVDTCKSDCTPGESLDACYDCRRRDDNCTNYMGAGINFFDECFTTPPEGQDETFVQQCSALSNCVTLSRCDAPDPISGARDIVSSCICGAGVNVADCSAEVVPAVGPCIEEYIAATGCGGNAKPIACAINLGADFTLPAGYVQILADCDQMYCLDECRRD